LFGAVAGFGVPCRDADADGHDAVRDALGVWDGEFFDGSAKSIHGLERVREGCVGDDEDEFFAAVSVGAVGAAGVELECLGDAAERVVSCEVSVGVVEEFELVEVAERDAVGVGVSCCAFVVALEVFVEAEAVAEAGEWIGAGLVGRVRR
jgi:hypothetical protein